MILSEHFNTNINSLFQIKNKHIIIYSLFKSKLDSYYSKIKL
jgi:hypothetical protein